MHQNKKLAKHLKSARLTLGFTIREVSMRTKGNVCNPYVSRLENGMMVNPSPKTLWHLARALKLNYLQLMRFAGYMTKGEKIK